ncbi:N-acetylglucosamine-6-phosphate deacetylase [Sulfitobacter sp. D35]|uniref:N-acetylglucosamine-6-phosphate deacetylase n=1 Tax=Sulfitobacter sp. D35 TaxID=3083252 RepID=UPI00296E397C|nr:N-acetylglucosamine-6-phosphate deacetylase [Sulfitobacter sp. D35]MDW4498483.1 N-acetylglucosamine-6-phosphate deacetylase [Sulfitobacter sp. D35]
MSRIAYTGSPIFDGRSLHRDSALLSESGTCRGIVDAQAIPEGYETRELDGVIAPGFVDLQVNGGGGVMFNDETTPEGLRAIAEAHASTGTLGLLPTLITDTPERTRAAIAATRQAIDAGVPGILGLHLEGPHLSQARKGAHDPALIRPMDAADEELLLAASGDLPNLMVTLAPESVSTAQIARLAAAGVIVSIGHSDCSCDAARAAFEAGACCVTHLFNAMSQLGSREPGLVGAALDTPAVSAGLIADDIHVHAATIRAALAAKRGPGGIFLVTDAMSTVGSQITEFRLNGRRILRRDGRLTLEDGTLAGADLDMPRAITVLRRRVGLDLDAALAMASALPAGILRHPDGYGSIEKDRPLRAIRLSAADDGEMRFERCLD